MYILYPIKAEPVFVPAAAPPAVSLDWLQQAPLPLAPEHRPSSELVFVPVVAAPAPTVIDWQAESPQPIPQETRPEPQETAPVFVPAPDIGWLVEPPQIFNIEAALQAESAWPDTVLVAPLDWFIQNPDFFPEPERAAETWFDWQILEQVAPLDWLVEQIKPEETRNPELGWPGEVLFAEIKPDWLTDTPLPIRQAEAIVAEFFVAPDVIEEAEEALGWDMQLQPELGQLHFFQLLYAADPLLDMGIVTRLPIVLRVHKRTIRLRELT